MSLRMNEIMIITDYIKLCYIKYIIKSLCIIVILGNF